ncbi:MAG: hypothetical protein BJ554DRAFT_7949 [Olpidium bornovanus]|uniref:Uncharacterized protein n=1 Tax=Olpidium bornovanus TaxID=278681 RepID=A0A8H7ZV73_9FUNG|nr:MAG: hypothetical protein BJ554DRAFT_7949 [Olpidium bornovanus]
MVFYFLFIPAVERWKPCRTHSYKSRGKSALHEEGSNWTGAGPVRAARRRTFAASGRPAPRAPGEMADGGGEIVFPRPAAEGHTPRHGALGDRRADHIFGRKARAVVRLQWVPSRILQDNVRRLRRAFCRQAGFRPAQGGGDRRDAGPQPQLGPRRLRATEAT